MSIDPCFHFGELAKGVLAGPLVEQEDPVFVPQPINTAAVRRGGGGGSGEWEIVKERTGTRDNVEGEGIDG